MKCGPFAAGGLALLALLAASSADSVVPARHQQLARGPEGTQLMVFGGRSAAQLSSPNAAKLDAALADLSRHLDRVRSDHALADLHSLSPAARFMRVTGSAVPLVAVDAVTRGDPARLKEELIALGMQRVAVFSNDVGGWLPVNQIEAAGALGDLASIHASMPRTRAVMATSQGDFAQRSDVVRANNTGLTGAGVTVGILSDSFDCYAVYDKSGSGVPVGSPTTPGYAPYGFATDDASFDETNGYLPASVKVLAEAPCTKYNLPAPQPQYFLPFADEGRAMMQILHDVAPGAAVAFYAAGDTQAAFASGIDALVTAGATVIADDIGYYDEPFFQDGIIAEAIDAAYAKGVAYFSAAGNDAQLSYETTTPSWTPAGARAGETALIFGTSGGTAQTSLPINLPTGGLLPGEFIGLIVEWDDPYLTGAPGSPGASSQIDLCVTGNGTQSPSVVLNLDLTAETCTGLNAPGVDPVQVLIVGYPASNNNPGPQNQTIQLSIGLKSGSPNPGRIKVVVADDGAGSVIAAFGTKSPTLQGHPGAAGAAAVGASFFAQTPRCGVDAVAVLEYYSSAGGDPILFDTSGTRYKVVPPPRQKPDFVGPDGVNTSFFGFPLAGSGFNDASTVAQCLNENDGAIPYNNFFGTSAATPHAAGIAALMRQANSAVTPLQIYTALRSTALPMGNGQPDYLDGAGFIQADAALASLPPGPPVMQLAASSITVGSSTKLTWSAYNVTSCSASGGWSGSQNPSGSVTVTPAAAGTETYTLTCMNPNGSAQQKATLTVQAASAGGGGGGGGGLDGLTLLALISLGCARALVPRAGDSVRG